MASRNSHTPQVSQGSWATGAMGVLIAAGRGHQSDLVNDDSLAGLNSKPMPEGMAISVCIRS